MYNLQIAINAFKEGKPVIIMDDDTRENEGDLCMPASFVTDTDVLFFLKYSTGLLCVACSPLRIEELELPPMIIDNTDPQKTPFTVSVDLNRKYGTTTGVSAQDKAKTIRALGDPNMKASDFCRPGHIFPLRASPQGLYGRQGHTEASVELCKLANVYPACLIAELMNPDGTMCRLKECQQFSNQHNIPLITVKQIQDEISMFTSKLPVTLNEKTTEFTISTFNASNDQHYVILSKGNLQGQKDVPLRIHSECLTGDVFHSARCDCRSQLDAALHMLYESERGVLIYVRGHEGRGIGLSHKIKAYSLQDTGNYDTYTANTALHLPLDCRHYEGVTTILDRMGIQSVILYTENSIKIQELAPYISKCLPLPGIVTSYNQKYIQCKSSGSYMKNISKDTSTDSKKKKIGIAYTTSWHTQHVKHMLEECRSYLAKYPVDIIERPVSGSFELVMGAHMLFQQGCDCVIVVGILLKGETHHFEAIISAVSQGIMSLQIEERKPIIFGVLACYNQDQIDDRVYGKKNAVEDWCKAAVDMVK